jgi:hypothetical protein
MIYNEPLRKVHDKIHFKHKQTWSNKMEDKKEGKNKVLIAKEE